jgi:hypothetical protein
MSALELLVGQGSRVVGSYFVAVPCLARVHLERSSGASAPAGARPRFTAEERNVERKASPRLVSAS